MKNNFEIIVDIIKYRVPKILVIGRPGSGKSTFSNELNIITNILLFHLDKYLFNADWKKKTKLECENIIMNIIKKNKTWIMDGNNAETLEMRLKYSNICFYFDFPVLICLYRVFKRYFSNSSILNDRAEGCEEKISFKLIDYVFNYDKYVYKKFLMLKNKYPHVKFCNFQSKKEIENFFEYLK